jgi:hypothetical protein
MKTAINPSPSAPSPTEPVEDSMLKVANSHFLTVRLPRPKPLSAGLRAWLARFLPARPEAAAGEYAPDLGRPTESGLSLHDAMAVRSAEFWQALGESRLALRELEALSDLARQHAWPLRVRLHTTPSPFESSNFEI